MSEYARFLEGSSRDLARARTPAERLHLDIFLIAPTLAIMVMGLFVLFSASDSDWDTVNRQIRNFVIGYGVFLSGGAGPLRYASKVGARAVPRCVVSAASRSFCRGG